MSELRPIDCQNPADELEPLYEAVVGPRRRTKERSARIDGVLSAALGTLSRELDKGEVAGYRGRPVPVRHFKSTPDRLLIVEAVNLASVMQKLMPTPWSANCFGSAQQRIDLLLLLRVSDTSRRQTD
jgi:hypothetical protein